MSLLLSIKSLSEEHFHGTVERVKLPGEKGSFEVLPHHAPLLSTLSKGDIIATTAAGTKQHFSIKKGLVQVIENTVTVWHTA